MMDARNESSRELPGLPTTHMADFTAWLHRETCTFPKLRFGVVPGFQGVSGIATAAIGPGETVAALAPRLLLTSSAAHAQIPELRAALAASSEPRLSRAAADRAAVWCLLIHERALKERSLWAPYIAILPTSATDHTVPTFHHAASDDVTAALAGTRMFEAVRRRLRVRGFRQQWSGCKVSPNQFCGRF